MVATLISLGANLGDPRESMFAAKRLLFDSFGVSNVRCSRLYRTPPVGGPSGQGDFLNAVAAIQTDKSVWEVWETIKSIESTLGRQRQLRWEARRIDIDLLLYGSDRIWTPHLKVPHPRMCMRTFVLLPACEVASDWVDPVTQWSILQLAENLRYPENGGLRVVCPDQSLLEELRELVGNQSTAPFQIEWHRELSQVRQLPKDSSGILSRSALTVFAVASPDPMTILWEDYSLPWAGLLELSPAGCQREAGLRLSGPRYLMPANDLRWAAHEIHSAQQAMTCNIEPIEAF
jgi:2-amino-4-hydroxy-6-hydroxymethyldihydropteridine diphosphokinase